VETQFWVSWGDGMLAFWAAVAVARVARKLVAAKML